MQRHLFRLLNAIQKVDLLPLGGRAALLRLMGAEVAPGAMLLAGVDLIQGPLALGRGAFINRGCLLDAAGGLTISTRVHLGPGVRLLTATHAIGGPACRAGAWHVAPVTIEDGAWIGAGATVLPGVTVRHGAVVAAGAVVTMTTEPDTLYAGVPAVRKRALPAN